MRLHRKVWEWCFIAQTLEHDGVLNPGRAGLGFAVGQEPLVAYFAARGPRILATDLDTRDAADRGWVASGEHAHSLDSLNVGDLCDGKVFHQHVSFRPLDMTSFEPRELGEFDFLWSSCAFEHLGSLQAGVDFVHRAMACLKPGGIAVHTTEFNVGSNEDTLTEGGVVIYRRRDIEQLVDELVRSGHAITVDWSMGTSPADYVVDIPPYRHDPHLKLHFAGYTMTSIGLAIRRGR